jgi:hypothetical protein
VAETFEVRFERAVSMIDAGDVVGLRRTLEGDPDLAQRRLERPWRELQKQVGDALKSFFARPYLLWFTTEDAIRVGSLPSNIAEVAGVILDTARGSEGYQEQIDYGLRLAAWSGVAARCGVQISLIDRLCDEGAKTDGVSNDALVNGHFEAAERLVERGAELTLPTAVCLRRFEEAEGLAQKATDAQRQFALVLAALNGVAEGVERLLDWGADANLRSEDLYSHGTPLHHAVCSGSMETVRVLVERGADRNARDSAFGGTPLGWAEHYIEEKAGADAEPYRVIAAYLRG